MTAGSCNRDGETLGCRIDIGAVFGAGTLESSLDIAPRAFIPTRGEVRPPKACLHFPVGVDVFGVVAGDGTVGMEVVLA